jgi:dihydropyrimidinase
MGGVISADDFYTQSISAAFGGVTTFMDFTNTNRGDSLLETFHERKRQMEKSAIDYSLHGRIVEAAPSVLEELAELVEAGCPSFKMYMTYKEDGFMIPEEEMLRVFARAKELGALSLIHCESDILCDYFDKELTKKNDFSWRQHANTKPILCEADAANRVINFSKAVGNSLLIVHTTNGAVLSSVREAQEKGYPVYTETCPHYLVVFEDIYDTKDGHLAICSPPLRTPKEAGELWNGMASGVVSVTGSDDCSFTRESKELRLERDEEGNIIPDYKKVVSGSSGIEARLAILLSEGVAKNRITMNQLVALTSTNPAELFGMYPQKGSIRCGSDADLVIVDMEAEEILSTGTLHNHVGYTIYEGLKVKGKPVATILRGKTIVERGLFLGERSGGRFVKRKIKQEILEKFSL